MSNKSDGPNTSPDKGISIGDVMTKLAERDGYILFAASLSNKVDSKNNRIIDFDYIRYHFSGDDSSLALQKFRDAIAKDHLEQLGIKS